APKIGDSLCAECQAHFAAVRTYLDEYGVEYTLVPTLVRGLDYYTRTAFEFVDEAIGAQSSICGGGRYDGLAEQLDGPHTPGIGFGAGIERLLISLELAGAEAEPPALDVFIVLARGGPKEPLLPLLAELRRAGVSADIDYADRSEKGQLSYATRRAAKAIVLWE